MSNASLYQIGAKNKQIFDVYQIAICGVLIVLSKKYKINRHTIDGILTTLVKVCDKQTVSVKINSIILKNINKINIDQTCGWAQCLNSYPPIGQLLTILLMNFDILSNLISKHSFILTS